MTKVLRILLKKKKNHPSDKADISKQSYLKEENLFPVIKRQRWEQGAGG